MKMKTGLAVIAASHVAHQAQHLALLTDIDRLVSLGREVEPADLRLFERADRRHRRTINAFLVGELGNSAERFLSGLQHENEDEAFSAIAEFTNQEGID